MSKSAIFTALFLVNPLSPPKAGLILRRSYAGMSRSVKIIIDFDLEGATKATVSHKWRHLLKKIKTAATYMDQVH